uniref:Tubulin--tyrosine ligase-like protein 5 n=1 Tax=Parastrongyloides trichosuri TaxID=131310 RepID=A0A0N4ZTE1_PARTI
MADSLLQESFIKSTDMVSLIGPPIPKKAKPQKENEDEDSDNIQDSEISNSSTKVASEKTPWTFANFNIRALQQPVHSRATKRYTMLGVDNNLTFKMVKSDNRLIRTIFYNHGFTECSPNNAKVNILWSRVHIRAPQLRNLQPWQKVNHFPKSFELTRKDRMSENLIKSKFTHGDAFSIFPETFIYPRDMEKLKEDMINNPSNIYIVKPPASSRGRGIHIINNIDEIDSNESVVISKYLKNPYLINGLKFDLRLYVLITSFYPLICYLYEDGLTRFASEKYSNDVDTLKQPFVHLTNYSLNKDNAAFEKNNGAEGEGHKWTLSAMLRHLKNIDGIDTDLLMVRIEDLIIKSLLSVQSVISAAARTMLYHPQNCFELLGYDIMIDENLKPWLIEVNLTPSLKCDSPLDTGLKSKLIIDTLNIVSLPILSYHKNRNGEDVDNEESLLNKSVEYHYDDVIGDYALDKKQRVYPTRSYNSLARKFGNIFNTKSKLKSIGIRRLDTNKLQRTLEKKVKLEENRLGYFKRLFPKPFTYKVYEPLMDYCGIEQWDKKLHQALFGEESIDLYSDSEFIRCFHQQMVNPNFDMPKKYQQESSLIMSEWLKDTSNYTESIFENNELPKTLPRIKINPRLRSHSFNELIDKNRQLIEEKKRLTLAQETLSKPDDDLIDCISNHWTFKN